MRVLLVLRARGYNPPTCLAMFIGQWAHQAFLWDLWSYEFYTKLQNAAYRFLGGNHVQGR